MVGDCLEAPAGVRAYDLQIPSQAPWPLGQGDPSAFLAPYKLHPFYKGQTNLYLNIFRLSLKMYGNEPYGLASVE